MSKFWMVGFPDHLIKENISFLNGAKRDSYKYFLYDIFTQDRERLLKEKRKETELYNIVYNSSFVSMDDLEASLDYVEEVYSQSRVAILLKDKIKADKVPGNPTLFFVQVVEKNKTYFLKLWERRVTGLEIVNKCLQITKEQHDEIERYIDANIY